MRLGIVTDYVPHISSAVALLERNDAENRKALYGRARVALVAQLREIKPSLTDLEIVREQAELEKAIRKVETTHSPPPPAPVPKGVTPIAPLPKLFPKSAD
jgi:hypothetical protein